ncbi:MAG: YlxR family protein [Erysipelotrichaceae bacterium]|nr:YlxR family protein [Erysipelotrichaceae bacterium]
MKKIPMRRCLATGESFPKKEMIRVVRTPEGDVKVDLSGKLNGKGAYLSRTKEALAIVKTKKALARALETEIPEEVYRELEEIIGG